MELILNRVARLWDRFESRSGNKEKWVRVIYREDRPLIVRYYLFNTRWIEDHKWLKPFRCLSFNVVIHHMFESDDDGLHDHPWRWFSWILAGGYYEDTPKGKFWRGPGHLRFRSANAFHRLILDPNNTKGGATWSLFGMGPREKEWGFLDRDNKWVPWFEHVHNNAGAMA